MYTIIRHVLLAVFFMSLALAALTARAAPAPDGGMPNVSAIAAEPAMRR